MDEYMRYKKKRKSDVIKNLDNMFSNLNIDNSAIKIPNNDLINICYAMQIFNMDVCNIIAGLFNYVITKDVCEMTLVITKRGQLFYDCMLFEAASIINEYNLYMPGKHEMQNSVYIIDDIHKIVSICSHANVLDNYMYDNDARSKCFSCCSKCLCEREKALPFISIETIQSIIINNNLNHYKNIVFALDYI